MAPSLINGLFTLVGAVLGAVVGGLFAWYIAKRNTSRSELTIVNARPVRLMEVDTAVSDLVELRVRGTKVPIVYSQDIVIKNTGTEPIHKGKISFALSGSGQMLTAGMVDSPRGGAEALTAQVEESSTDMIVQFEYINPREEFLLRLLLDAHPAGIVATFRQPGVNFVTQQHSDPTDLIMTDVMVAASRSILVLLELLLTKRR